MNEDARGYESAVDWVTRRAGAELPVDDHEPRLDALGLVGRYVRGELSLPEFEERRDAVAERSADPTLGLQVEALCRGVDAVRSGDRPADERRRRYRSLARWTVDPLAERTGLPDDRPPELDVGLVRDETSGDAPIARHDLRRAFDDGDPGYDLLPAEPSAVRSFVEDVHAETTTGVPFLAPAEARYAAGVDAAATFARAADATDPALDALVEAERTATEAAGDGVPALRRLCARAAVAAEALDGDAVRSHPVEAAAATFADAVGAEGPTGTDLPAETVDEALRDALPDDPGPVAAAGATALDDLARPVSARLSAVDRAAATLDGDAPETEDTARER